MKRKFISGLLIIALAFSAVSCNSESEEVLSKAPQNVESMETLKGNLLELNKNYENIDAQGTRFKFKKWFRWLTVAVADVGTFVLSNCNVGSAVGASKATNDFMKSLETSDAAIPTANGLKKAPLDGVEAGSAGYIHNSAILNMYEKYGEALDTMSTRQLLDVSMEEVALLQDKAYADSIDEETYETVEKIVSKFDPEKSLSENIELFKTLATDSLTKYELDLCNVMLEGLQLVDDDDTSYYGSANNLIRESDLSAEEKEKMQDALSIGYASAKLWNTSVPEKEE